MPIPTTADIHKDGIARIGPISSPFSSAHNFCVIDMVSDKVFKRFTCSYLLKFPKNIYILKRLREAVRRKRPEALTNNTWMLLHHNAPAHTSLLIREFLTKHESTVVPQPLYSTNLPPADFSLFPKLKFSLKGRRFQTVEEIEKNLIRELRAIPQNTFQNAFQNWEIRWARCIKIGREYFEGDKFV